MISKNEISVIVGSNRVTSLLAPDAQFSRIIAAIFNTREPQKAKARVDTGTLAGVDYQWQSMIKFLPSRELLSVAFSFPFDAFPAQMSTIRRGSRKREASIHILASRMRRPLAVGIIYGRGLRPGKLSSFNLRTPLSSSVMPSAAVLICPDNTMLAADYKSVVGLDMEIFSPTPQRSIQGIALASISHASKIRHRRR